MHKLRPNVGRLALDETGQIIDIAQGNMALFGWRPLEPVEHEEFMDGMDRSLKPVYEKVVMPTLPGILSSFAIKYHSGYELPEADKHDIRANMNIKDVVDLRESSRARIQIALSWM